MRSADCQWLLPAGGGVAVGGGFVSGFELRVWRPEDRRADDPDSSLLVLFRSLRAPANLRSLGGLLSPVAGSRVSLFPALGDHLSFSRRRYRPLRFFTGADISFRGAAGAGP